MQRHPVLIGRMADAIPGATYDLFEGTDHAYWIGPLREPIRLDRIEDFVTGTPRRAKPAERALATMLLTEAGRRHGRWSRCREPE